MQPTASTAMVIAIVAVVLGGIGLIGGVLGYVQGMNAVARATHARQRAVVAEEEAIQARAAAEATARAAEELLGRSRSAAGRVLPTLQPAVAPAPSGAEPIATTSGALLLPETTGPTAVQIVPAEPESGSQSVPPTTSGAIPVAEVAPAAPVLPPDPSAQPHPDRAPADGPRSPREAAPEVSAGAADATTALAEPVTAPAEEFGASRDEGGRVVAGEQAAPTMDWAEVLKTGAIPLPSISRGTYSAPRRRPRPTGEGPVRFELRAIGRQRFEAVNVGGEPAADALLEGGGDDPHLIRPLSSRPSTVAPGAALAFSVLRVEGRRATVVVRWSGDGEALQQDLALD